ncbi:peptidoglycan editing factor PgeF [Sporolactobacillus kofuensis]|uniref:Purine nucleoside phosphorylase n=1 Tax=Sporolactobacillus kofuensis TaxID=269672 RepID=A0ABW1WEH5_9BACL|nr:peptidoglycan editing factor PgeF [Sporolactobacillus kofuensis]MCO7174626.1 peptidoglycan editing factor PgeF [Sporolactobacillus kofuensis]
MDEPFSFRNGSLLMMNALKTSAHEICSGFTMRNGGTSTAPFSSMNLGLHVGDDPEHVLENRQRIADQTSFPLDHWICAEQVHGTNIARVTKEHAGAGSQSLETTIKGVDGLFTTEPGLFLALCFADCVPIYYWASNPDVIAIMHAGWRGTVAGGAVRMVEKVKQELALSPESLHVVIGPSIGASDYEVDQKVINEVSKLDQSLWKQSVKDVGDGHYLLNLQMLNKNILIAGGVPEKQIQVTRYRTFDHPDLFFSFRQDQGKTGRMMGYIGMK